MELGYKHWLIFVLVALVVRHTDGQGILVIARTRSLRWLDLTVADDRGTPIPVTGLSSVRAVSFHLESGRVYWSDTANHTISRAALNGSDQEVVLSGIDAHGLVIDQTGNQIYWTDPVRHVIEGMSLDRTDRRTVMSTDLDEPWAIDLDTGGQYRNLYWTDVGTDEKIERSVANGTARRTLVNDNLFYPYGLVLDSPNGVMYWAEAGNSLIETASLDGTNRRDVTYAENPTSLTMFEGFLYWSDSREKAIIRVNKTTGTESTKLLSYIPKVNGIRTIALSAGESVAFIAGDSEIREYRLGSSDDLGTVIPVQGLDGALTVDYDPVEGYVYWGDVNLKHISRARRDGTGQEVLVDTDVGSVEAIAVGETTRRLYWTDSLRDTIDSCDLDGTNRVVLINLGLDRPRALALDESNSKMYWTDWGSAAKIERASLDGSSREEVVNSSLAWPNGLALDLSAGKMYWVDSLVKHIEVANLDGSGRQVLLSDNNQQAYGLSILGENLYWTDWASDAAYRTKVNAPNDVEIVVDANSPFTSVSHVPQISPRTTRSSTTTTTTTTTTPPPREPQVTSVVPDFGPVAGGTFVVITGQNFPRPVDHVRLGKDLIVDVTDSSETTIAVTTPPVNGSYTGLSLPVAVQFLGKPVLTTSFSFKYRANPSVISVEPLVTIPDGGITLTVNGTDLDSVANPEMNMTLVTGSQKGDNEMSRIPYLLPCETQSATQMYCITPELDLPDRDLPCHVGNAGDRECSDQVTIYIGIILDGVPDYRNLSSNPELREYGRLSLTASPKFSTHQDFEYIGQPIDIQGENVETCCGMQEFRVYVGKGPCIVVHMADDLLSCQPPDEPPEHSLGREGEKGYRVQVHVGENLQALVGTLMYEKGLPVWVGPVAALCVLAVAAAVVVPVVLTLRKRRANKPKKDDESKLDAPMENDGTIELPNVRVSNLGELHANPNASGAVKTNGLSGVKKTTNCSVIDKRMSDNDSFNGHGIRNAGFGTFVALPDAGAANATYTSLGADLGKGRDYKIPKGPGSSSTYMPLGGDRVKDGDYARPQYPECNLRGQKPYGAHYTEPQTVRNYMYDEATPDVLPAVDDDPLYVNAPYGNLANQ